MANDELMTLEETAKYLKVAVVTLRGWIRDNKIKSHRIGRAWRFYKSDIDVWIRENKKEAKNEQD